MKRYTLLFLFSFILALPIIGMEHDAELMNMNDFLNQHFFENFALDAHVPSEIYNTVVGNKSELHHIQQLLVEAGLGKNQHNPQGYDVENDGLDARDNKDEPLLIKLIHCNKIDFACDIIEKGANVHASDQYKMTPLMVAATSTSPRSIKCVEKLLEYGARVTDKSSYWKIYSLVRRAQEKSERSESPQWDAVCFKLADYEREYKYQKRKLEEFLNNRDFFNKETKKREMVTVLFQH